jgi:hypothetical protein
MSCRTKSLPVPQFIHAILGTVKDSTGSVIPGADIKIINEDEGATLAYTTDESGNFLIPDLKPGRYSIEVQKDGFKAGSTQRRAVARAPGSARRVCAECRNAFTCPGIANWTPGTACNIGAGSGAPNPIGRFGNAHVGDVTGPGIVNLSTGLSKQFALTERVHLKAGASFTNVLNHPNLADNSDSFNLIIASGDFGKISAARGSDFGGSRTGQVFLRLDF